MEKINNDVLQVLSSLGFKQDDRGYFRHKTFSIPFNFSKCLVPSDIPIVIYKKGEDTLSPSTNLEDSFKRFED